MANVSIDWLTVTFHGWDYDDVLSFFGGGSLREGYHKNFYDRVFDLSVGGFLMFHTERVEMGVCVSLPGAAVDRLRGLWDMDYDHQVVSACRGFVGDRGRVNCSRIDFALDDEQGLLDLDQIVAARNADAYVSRWRSSGVFQQGKRTSAGIVDAGAVTFGSRSSDGYCRIYDKRAEQFLRGVEDLPEHWMRVEIEFKRDRAQSAFDRVVSDRSVAWVGGVMRGYLDFKIPGDDTNRSRWETCEWWVLFCSDCRDHLEVAIETLAATIEAVKDWVDRQVGPSLAAISLTSDGTVWLRDKLVEWVPRISRPLMVAVERGA